PPAPGPPGIPPPAVRCDLPGPPEFGIGPRPDPRGPLFYHELAAVPERRRCVQESWRDVRTRPGFRGEREPGDLLQCLRAHPDPGRDLLRTGYRDPERRVDVRLAVPLVRHRRGLVVRHRHVALRRRPSHQRLPPPRTGSTTRGRRRG